MYKNYGQRHSFAGPPKGLIFLLVILVGFIILSGIVMLLWNLILVDLTAVKTIKFWQAAGLLLLSRILFGSFHFGSKHRKFSKHRAQWKEKWMSMNEEEREAFRERWKARCRKN